MTLGGAAPVEGAGDAAAVAQQDRHARTAAGEPAQHVAQRGVVDRPVGGGVAALVEAGQRAPSLEHRERQQAERREAQQRPADLDAAGSVEHGPQYGGAPARVSRRRGPGQPDNLSP